MSQGPANEIPEDEKGRAPGLGEYFIAALLIVLTATVVVVLYGQSIRDRFEKLGIIKTAQQEPGSTK